MDEVMSSSISRQNFNMLLLTIFAASALILAAVGIYGVVSIPLLSPAARSAFASLLVLVEPIFVIWFYARECYWPSWESRLGYAQHSFLRASLPAFFLALLRGIRWCFYLCHCCYSAQPYWRYGYPRSEQCGLTR
jgi:hypothetical protein